jgi:site-specific recombinase XerD
VITIEGAIQLFLDDISGTHSKNTLRVYRNGLMKFKEALVQEGIALDQPISVLDESWIGVLACYLNDLSKGSNKTYLAAVQGFYNHCAVEGLKKDINLARAKALVKEHSQPDEVELPNIPRQDIERVIEYAETLPQLDYNNYSEKLTNLRNCAFILTLADTGLRVHEACNLTRGDIDWLEGTATIIAKDDKQAEVPFSNRSLKACHEYLRARAFVDRRTKVRLLTLPLFSRHDKVGLRKTMPISTNTGRNIVNSVVSDSLSDAYVGTITPHSFRHYFVTNVLMKTGDITVTKELARHTQLSTTKRYTHLLD